MTAIVKNTGNFVETEIDDEIVLMRLSDGDFFSLEGTALTIWQAIDGLRDAAALTAFLAETFDAPAEAIRADVDRFVADLAAAGLLSA